MSRLQISSLTLYVPVALCVVSVFYNKIVVAAHDARGRAHSCSMGRVPEELALRPRAKLTRIVPLRSKLLTYINVTMAHAQLQVVALAQQRLDAAASQRSRMRRVVRLQQTSRCRQAACCALHIEALRGRCVHCFFVNIFISSPRWPTGAP